MVNLLLSGKRRVKKFIEDPGLVIWHDLMGIVMGGCIGGILIAIMIFMETRVIQVDSLTKTESMVLEIPAVFCVIYGIVRGMYLHEKYEKGDKTAPVKIYIYINLVALIIGILGFNQVFRAIVATVGLFNYLFENSVIIILIIEIVFVIGCFVISIFKINSAIKKNTMTIRQEEFDAVGLYTLMRNRMNFTNAKSEGLALLNIYTLLYIGLFGPAYMICSYKLKLLYAKKFELEDLLPQMEKEYDLKTTFKETMKDGATIIKNGLKKRN